MLKLIEKGKRIGQIGLLRRNAWWFAQKKQDDNSRKENEHRNGRNMFKKIGFGICAASIAYFLFNTSKFTDQPPNSIEDKPNPLKNSKIQLGGEWKLQDCSSNLFTSDQLKGSFYLIYFGYAFCPDICPITLNYLGNVYRQHHNINQSNNLKVVFVSVDPKRDRPETIKKYLRLFDPSFIGLTAKDQDDEDFKDITKKFKVYANKIQGEGGSYNIDHTSLVFLMGPNGQFIDLLNTTLPQKQTVQFLINKLQAYKQSSPKS